MDFALLSCNLDGVGAAALPREEDGAGERDPPEWVPSYFEAVRAASLARSHGERADGPRIRGSKEITAKVRCRGALGSDAGKDEGWGAKNSRSSEYRNLHAARLGGWNDWGATLLRQRCDVSAGMILE
jgi:hypothetical protein